MVRVVVALLACGALAGIDKPPIPDAQEQKKAERLIRDLYRQELASAKRAVDKALWAREILRVAKEEPDPTTKFAALQIARRLAIEAQAGALAVEIVKTIATNFDFGDQSGTELLQKAEELWERSNRQRGITQLRTRIDALELYYRSGTNSPLVIGTWKPRIDEVCSVKVPLQPPELSRTTVQLLRAINGATVAFFNKKTGYVVNVYGAARTPGARIIQNGDKGTHECSKWIIQVDRSGYCFLRNKNSNLWLTVVDNGARVTQGHQDSDALWELRPVANAPGYLYIVHARTGLCLGPSEPVPKPIDIKLYPPDEDASYLHWRIAPVK